MGILAGSVTGEDGKKKQKQLDAGGEPVDPQSNHLYFYSIFLLMRGFGFLLFYIFHISGLWVIAYFLFKNLL